jgi:hypothetical protein
MRVPSLVFFAATVSLCAFDALAGPRSFVSAVSGSDLNPCSRTLPCRSFAAAVLQTDVDGEVIPIDSGGFGVVTITQSVSIVSPLGVYAGITAGAGDALLVAAGNFAHVTLKNLYFNSVGADTGINADTVGALYIDGCVLNGFVTGIFFNPTSSNSRLYVSNTFVRRSEAGIQVIGGFNTRAVIESVRLHGNTIGVFVQNAEATIRKSVASSGDKGFAVGAGGKLTIEDSISTANSYGFYANAGSVMALTRCAAASNTIAGIEALFSPTIIYVADCTITANTLGVDAAAGAVVRSRGNNTLQANTNDGAFTNTFLPS